MMTTRYSGPTFLAALIACSCGASDEATDSAYEGLEEDNTPQQFVSSSAQQSEQAAAVETEPPSTTPNETSNQTEQELEPELSGSDTQQVGEPLPSDCTPPAGVSGAPRDVPQLLELINSLPKPVTVACFLESLERPLEVFMTSSTFSAQPAFFESPRTFIFFEPLVISIVPGGTSQNLLEFGERTPDLRSIKGEIEFPVYENVGSELLRSQVQLSREGSICGGCHAAEVRLDTQSYEAAFESVIIVPDPVLEVNIEDFKARTENCDYQYDGTRCAILDALFDHGEVIRTSQWQ